ncbi:UDP-phosphate N-acetylgalactosaminyl-1-phosphate transferase [Bacillus pseudomycoides]|uniref:UDP-phosphate N-acetylgalactosaminyl-1-phosphate transferase n=1 Tax=Bacillus pseudomycoides TaxID=64104 RepID=A0ABD6T4C9_9BACI|nr:sugar transferase [Bacillus pseudomycoides]PDZ71733.1 UDP-phosphate N-acetylgalactosaminyl-1-phosphate transferase [Bacillus pseudomycoides]PEJ27426.1 UDP-phosphate N-acetylgalactosaminyl-1-phosphate transferase [Bacillus pseudomycoides]PEP87298.1 UDP-phosphate N-acetylgalactosaminyl-1-phosphate transferase [Bacillus pseudomycoides]PGF08491.1 UDP-phosphate N-acetylgalactosaminyl-1-phosphate transferase [Bacillus pseudomycoides]PHC35830.1 UDP-phosphate N-acetylgalactosaminyl-1-phosphate tran
MDPKIKIDRQVEIQVQSLSTSSYLLVKRLIDFVFSLFMLLLLSPILVLFCILIPIESTGSPFFYQRRLGKNGKDFKLIKLRSMFLDAEKNGPQWASKEDPRVTRVGTFIRKTRIDEIPQVINVLKGDMSLIGPRPEREYFYKRFDKSLPNFKHRLLVTPGITGLAQVNGGYDLTPEEKLAFDLYYIQHRSFAMEIKILCQTLAIVFTGNGAR